MFLSVMQGSCVEAMTAASKRHFTRGRGLVETLQKGIDPGEFWAASGRLPPLWLRRRKKDHVLLMKGLRFVFNRERTAAARRGARAYQLEHVNV
jgi:hypothetical protein